MCLLDSSVSAQPSTAISCVAARSTSTKNRMVMLATSASCDSTRSVLLNGRTQALCGADSSEAS